MKLLLGAGLVILSIGLVVLSFFLNFENIADNILSFLLILLVLPIIYNGIKLIINYLNNNRLQKKGITARAKIVGLKRTLLDQYKSPDYIIEVSYNHPNDKKTYYTEFEYSGKVSENIELRKGNAVNILVDPKNPKKIYYKN